jgi:hypothetical protein
VVSEPPGEEAPEQADARWPQPGLAELGYARPVAGGGYGASFVVIEKTKSDDRWPRRVGIPSKRPVWT